VVVAREVGRRLAREERSPGDPMMLARCHVAVIPLAQLLVRCAVHHPVLSASAQGCAVVFSMEIVSLFQHGAY